MLKLNHKAMRGTNISDMLFPGLPIVLDKLLAFRREIVLPNTMPFRLPLPPRITVFGFPVRPMPHAVLAAFGDHGMTATAAFSSKARLCLSIIPFDVSKLHRLSPQAVCSENCSRLVENPPDSFGVRPTQRRATKQTQTQTQTRTQTQTQSSGVNPRAPRREKIGTREPGR